jgi:enoyl-CoA hydratase
MVRGIVAGVDHAMAHRARALVVTAVPPVFCAGGSLEDLHRPRAPLEEMYLGAQAIAQIPIPTVAAVNGATLGAGLNIPLACDVILCTPDSRFDVRFLDLALHPGGGQLWGLRQRVGRQQTAALSLFGEALSGTDAERCGLAWRCVPSDDLDGEAARLAYRAATRDPALAARVKGTLDASASIEDWQGAVALELAPQLWSMQRPEFLEALDGLRARLRK